MEHNVEKILDLLMIEYPDAKCELEHKDAFQLLVATILSAQTTDVKVNEVTKTLFKEYPTVDDFLTLSQDELESRIRTIGLYRNKSKNILAMCKKLKEEFNGNVPSTMDGITSLPGAGRKTANVVLSNAFNVPAIAVDTHVFRVSNRIGLAHAKDVNETEKQLQKNIPKSQWSHAHHLLIFHGRRCCSARKPQCESCKIASYCNFFKDNN
ncbi:endonuclease III [Clostridium frigidicarnis]|uniref:Endonuclease III n=1 Tax=Clostridium frigidicarnis TaxID=84698 RepID=A0A1I1AE66_9CLOT|nr:endonuclease III [Clostridium frigidicarnis]SFB36257.1 DNA-(apurinic or apyrimidinic site) lyase /endonuclease III [Clostridium frigidicarnis]